ncbi:MAG: winged helix-turn-helix transcriptional regulator [Endomicrobium sp.]|jgi:ATP-dependent DNA helicase RecG|nr:winged helix-turn-helix transcriptional regulator [Endomicrobium sp.]
MESAEKTTERSKEKSKEKSNEKSKEKSIDRIIEIIMQKPYITTKELADILKLSIAGVEKNIRQLKEQKKIRRIGPDKGGHWEII